MRLLLWRVFQFLAIVGVIVGAFLMVSLNQTRCAPACMGANLAGSTLRGANLSGTDLTEARLSNSTLEQINLSGANLSGATVTRSMLVDADLSNAILVGADFTGSDLRGVNLKGANLNGATLTNVNLTGVDLREAASLRGLVLDNAQMIGAQFAGTNLSGVSMQGTKLTSANLERVNLSGAYLSGASLAGAVLHEADLSGAWLNLADLTGADLSGVSLAGAALIGTTLASANLNHANLSGAAVIGANFDGADLRNANISGARFLASDLGDLDVTVDSVLSELSGTEINKLVRNARLKGVRFDDTVIWSPDSKSTLETLLGFPLTLPVTVNMSPTVVGGIDLGPVNPAQQTGPISITGSATVAPLTQAIADKFSAAGFADTITVTATDTGPGFEQLCTQGDVDIADASRVISDAERAACVAIKRTPLGLRIGMDAVIIVVHPSNNFISNASLSELQRLFTAYSWSDVNPHWPRRPIERFVPTPGSGTRTFFEQRVGVSENDLSAAGNTTSNRDMDTLAEALAQSPFGIGFLSYAAFQKHIDQLQAVKVGGVTISYQNIEESRYPLSRSLYIYTDTALLQRKPQLAAFITFYLQQLTIISQEMGFLPPSRTILNESAAAFQQVLTPAKK